MFFETNNSTKGLSKDRDARTRRDYYFSGGANKLFGKMFVTKFVKW